ncbi:MAG: PRC-barrel domain-containing protein [Ignavibacteriales bacterium]
MKGRKLLGAPVVDRVSGDILGTVCDLVLGHDLEVMGLLVEPAKGAKGMLAWDDFSINDDTVMVSGLESLKRLRKGKPQDTLQDQMGVAVIDDRGRKIGQLSDVVVEPVSKETRGVEVSHGILKDFIDGRTEISMNRVRTVDEEALVLGDEGGMME